jgi:hypothetical protein
VTENSVNIINILDCSSIDLSLWLVTNILDLKVPATGPNTTMSGPMEALRVMGEAANRIMLVTELYVQVVGATPTQTSVRSNKESFQELGQEMNKRKDILYRTLQSLEALRDTASRMVTTANQQIRTSM